MIESTEQSRRPRKGFKIPPPVAIGITVVLVIIAAWLVYDNVFRTTAVDLTKYEPIDTRQPNPNRRMRNAMANNPGGTGNNAQAGPRVADTREGVFRTTNGFDVLVPGARARFIRNGPSLRLELNYVGQQLYNPKERHIAMARFFALNEKPLADAAKVTPEQIEKLKPLDFPRGIVTNDDAYKSLLDLGVRYDKATDADKARIGNEMVARLKTTAESGVAITSAAYEKNAAEVRKILTDEQINLLRARRG